MPCGVHLLERRISEHASGEVRGELGSCALGPLGSPGIGFLLSGGVSLNFFGTHCASSTSLFLAHLSCGIVKSIHFLSVISVCLSVSHSLCPHSFLTGKNNVSKRSLPFCQSLPQHNSCYHFRQQMLCPSQKHQKPDLDWISQPSNITRMPLSS